MSVLIRGMEMPKGCAFCRIVKRNGKKMVCPLLDEEWDIHDPMSADHRLADCPLVHVPQHGRLIDEDALLQSHSVLDGIYFPDAYIPATAIKDAPTIIPAEPCNNLSKPCKEAAP